MKRHLNTKHIAWVLPLLAFVLIAPFTPQIDLAVSNYFYKDGSFEKNEFIQLFYEYGTYPAWLAGFDAAFILIMSLISPIWKRLQKAALLFLAPLAIGCWLITNELLKNYWQRPRPVQTSDFGGFAPYHPFWNRLTEVMVEPCKSFPCGHCTMGFVFFALIFIGIRLKNRFLLYSGVFLTLFLGIGLSISRIAAGGHYFSDTLFAALLMWLVCLGTDRFLYRDRKICTV